MIFSASLDFSLLAKIFSMEIYYIYNLEKKMSRKKNQLEANWLNYFLLHYSEYVPFFTPTQNIK